MARTTNTGSKKIIGLLDKLIDKKTESKEYAHTMYELGEQFGMLLFDRLENKTGKIAIASTVEDADYLGKGMIDFLEKNGKEVLLTVFWNKRLIPNEETGNTIAPIIKEFHDIGYQNAHTLIIIKSIIASSCVVRTNLTRLIEESAPDQIFVVAPVLLKGAIQSLENEFDTDISQKFEYLYFAEDDKEIDGLVEPGIGGDVYIRLGFEGQTDKNKLVPSIVKERRYRQQNIS